MYATLQLEASETGKLEAELSPAADSLAVAARRLIVRDRVTGIEFLVDTGADVSTIPVSRRDHIHIGKQVLYAANGMIIPIDKNYSSLIWDSVVFFNGLS